MVVVSRYARVSFDAVVATEVEGSVGNAERRVDKQASSEDS